MAKQPIPRRYVENVLHLVESIQRELKGGLDPEKGYISEFYVREKLDKLTHELNYIFDPRFSDEVIQEKKKESA